MFRMQQAMLPSENERHNPTTSAPADIYMLPWRRRPSSAWAGEENSGSRLQSWAGHCDETVPFSAGVSVIIESLMNKLSRLQQEISLIN